MNTGLDLLNIYNHTLFCGAGCYFNLAFKMMDPSITIRLIVIVIVINY